MVEFGQIMGDLGGRAWIFERIIVLSTGTRPVLRNPL